MSRQSYLKSRLTKLPDFVFTFIQSYYDGESVNTQIAYTIDISIYLQFLQVFKYPSTKNLEDFTCSQLENVTLDDLINFKSYLREYDIHTHSASGDIVTRTVTNSSYGINRKLSAIRSLYSYLYKTDKISHNITDKLDFSNVNQKIKKPLTAQETVRILDVIFNGEKYFSGRDLSEYQNRKLRDIALFITYLGTGVRVSELIGLNVSDICFDTSSFIVTRKGGQQQEVFMPAQVENELLNYIVERKKVNAVDKDALFLSRLNKRLTVSSVERNLKRYCQTAGVHNPDKTRPHALRRTFACRLLEDGVDIKMVAELMGHRNIEVTHKFYAQYSSAAKRDIMRGFKVIAD